MNTVSTIYINGREAENSLKGLTSLAAQLGAELKRTELGSEAFAKKAMELHKVTAVIEEQKNKLKEYIDAYGATAPADKSMARLRATHQELLKDLDRLEVGTEGWLRKLNEVNASKANLDAVQAQINGVDKAVEGSLRHMREQHQVLIKDLDNLEAGTEAWNNKLKDVNKSKANLDSLEAEMKAVDKATQGSLRHLHEQHQVLVKDLSNLKVGTKEWVDKLKEVNASQAHLDDIDAKMKGATNQSGMFSGALGKVGGAMVAAFAVDRIVTFVDELRKTAVMLDTYNTKTTTVFGEASRIVEDSATKQAADLGLASSQYKLLATDVGDLLVPMGFQREEAARVSTQLVNLSGVLAEWSGGQKNATEVSGSLRKALMGEYEELESVGIKLSEQIVKDKLAADGKDKLKGAALEQAKAQAVLALIMEKSQDAQTAFANNQDSLARQSARLSASFQTIKETLAASLIPLFEKVTSATATLIVGSNSLSDKMRQESIEVGGVVNQIVSYNQGNETRNALIKELQAKYPDFLKNLDAEKVTNEQLQQRLQEVNKQYMAKVMAIEISKEVEDAQKRELDVTAKISQGTVRAAQSLAKAQQELGDATLSGLKARQLLHDKWENTSIFSADKGRIRELMNGLNYYLDVAGNSTNVTDIYAKATEKAKEGRQKVIDALKQQNPEIAKELDDLINPKIIEFKQTGNGGTPKDEEAEKAAKKAEEALKSINDRIKALRNDALQSTKEGIALEVSKINEKYDKELEAVKEFAKKFPSKNKEAHDLEKILRGSQNQEIKSLYEKHFKGIENDLEKHLDDLNTQNLSADEREYQAIFDKYQKQIDAAKDLENNFTNATAAQRTAAHELRIKLEAIRDKEISDAKSLRAAEEFAKESEESKAFLEKRELERVELKKKIQEEVQKPVETDNKESDTSQYLINLALQQESERAQLRTHFNELMKLAEDYGVNTTALKEKQKAQEDAIDKKYKKLTITRQLEDNNKRIQAYGSLFSELGQLSSAFGQLIGNEGEKQSAFAKVLTLTQIAFDTAAAISSLTKHSEANPANGVTGGIAGTIQFVTGLARIVANIAKAKQVLSAAPPVQQKFEGGYHNVKGAQDGRTYNARYIGQRTTGMLPETPSLVLASERGPEYFVSNEALARPDVAWHVRAIENIVSYRQFADGGFTANAPAQALPLAAPAQQPIALPSELITAINLLNNILQRGIQAEAVIGYPQVRDIRDGISRINKIEGQ
jgi:hypothetical protein